MVNFKISLAATPERERDATVYWTTGPDTEGDAVAGLDYVYASGPLVFKPGETTKTIPITIREDSEVEINERIWIQFSNPVNMAFDEDIRRYNNRTSIIIEDND